MLNDNYNFIIHIKFMYTYQNMFNSLYRHPEMIFLCCTPVA